MAITSPTSYPLISISKLWYKHSNIYQLMNMHNMDKNTTKYATLIDAARGRNVSLSGSIDSLVGFHREYLGT